MAVSSSTFQAEVAGVLVAVSLVVVAIYALFRYMRRRGPELAAREGRAVLEDRSYNRIRIGHAAADHLARSGVDVSSARALLEKADTFRKGGDHTSAIEFSKKAQDLLAAARSADSSLPSGGTLRSSSAVAVGGQDAAPPSRVPIGSSPDTPGSAAAVIPNGLPAGSGGESSSVQGANRPPKNKMEAHFQLSVARDELEQARASKSDTPAYQGAETFLAQGQQAYDRADCTEALRLALKSRRTLGARVEALPLTTPSTATVAPTEAPSTGRGGGESPEDLSSGPRCSNCGRPALAADQFCRGCGARIAPTPCVQCGAPLVAGDRFCGKCGAVQPSSASF